MKRYIQVICLTALASSTGLVILNAGLKNEVPALSISTHTVLSDNYGVMIPRQIAILKVGDLVKFYRPDKTEYIGRVTEIEETPERLRIIGDCVNFKDAGFGFVLAKGGFFAGAILDRTNGESYFLEFSLEHKGYIFLKEALQKKPNI